ncbi:calcineurin-like phosphoesterase C-terminal domain-containing protein [Alkalicaulis satelles]|nr:calcineurin-like phosphoesterase C-terminal domain-containing protein [Alkalicaulis satelles]
MRLVLVLALGAALTGAAQADRWEAAPQVINPGAGGETIRGVVFEDANRNGVRDAGEAGVAGVLVSNGLDWVRTDENGAYEIAVRDDMDLTIVQPSGWRVPTDHRLVPQFFYTHKPGGTGNELRFGGLEDTGPAPEAVNFPLIREGAAGQAFTCAVLADPQTYSNDEIGYLRDGVTADLIEAGFSSSDCLILAGDVVGDDLGLLDRLLEVTATANAPQWLVVGNHDIDFDARTNADKADSWRRIVGPNYYAFEMGQVLFVVLDNVDYPCQAGRDWCGGERPFYNGIVSETQMSWLSGLLEHTPEDRLVVLAHHIPFVSFVDATSDRHQTDNAAEIHALLEGREALSISGHTHTTENHAPGQIFEGWAEQTGIGPLPFRHIIAGAASGAWYQGDFNVDGVPMALQRMGAPMGHLRLDFEGADYVERYIGARIDPRRGQWVGLNTPAFRDWFETIAEWVGEDWRERDSVPPASINDLPDTRLLTADDFAGGVWLTANVWAGSAETRVSARLPGGETLILERTQEGAGEAARIGAEWADPFAVQRQASVGRYALESRSGDERAQGHELFRGSRFGPSAPQPQRAVAERNMHLWRARLPELPEGVHRIAVTSTDRNGLVFTDTLVVEVRSQRPPRRWRAELWD